MKNFSKYLIFTGLILVSSYSFSQSKNKFGKGIINVMGKDSTFSMNVGLRIQSLYSGQWDAENDELDNFGNPTTNFMIRRSRLKFGGFAYSPKLQYKIELGLSNKDLSGGIAQHSNASRMILDAVIKWNFYQNFTLWAGQTKIPGNRERLVSSANLQMVDRSRLNSKFTLDRDMGIQLRHHFTLGKSFLIREAFSLSQGEGRNVTTGNIGGMDYTFKMEFLPFGEFSSKGDYKGGDLKREKNPKLAIGITYDINDKAGRKAGQKGSYIGTTINNLKTLNTIFVDFIFKYRGFSLMGEYVKKSTEDNNPEITDALGNSFGRYYTGEAINLQTGYLFNNNWETSLRFTHISPDAGVSDKENEYTIGISKYIAGHKLKVQTDLSYREIESKDDVLFYRLQFELHF